jgi:hypothetical protein
LQKPTVHGGLHNSFVQSLVRQTMSDRPAIKLMPDYECWPLWHHGGNQVGNIDPRSIGVSDPLANDLERWADVYESHLDRSDPVSTKWTDQEQKQFDAEGRGLCRRLAVELRTRYSVFYFDPFTKDCIPAEALPQ